MECASSVSLCLSSLITEKLVCVLLVGGFVWRKKTWKRAWTWKMPWVTPMSCVCVKVVGLGRPMPLNWRKLTEDEEHSEGDYGCLTRPMRLALSEHWDVRTVSASAIVLVPYRWLLYWLVYVCGLWRLSMVCVPWLWWPLNIKFDEESEVRVPRTLVHNR